MEQRAGSEELRQQLYLYNMSELSRKSGVAWNVIRDFRNGNSQTLSYTNYKAIACVIGIEPITEKERNL